MIRINLWASPRNVSTAMMYSWAQRADTVVLDEPLYGHFLRVTDRPHPGKEETLAQMETDGEKVVQEQLLGDFPKPVAFFKQMTHHLVDLDWSFMLGMKNIIFTRNPGRILMSYAKVIAHPTIDDIGLKKQMELLQYLEENEAHYLVLDSKSFLENPKEKLEQICEHIAIPADEKMLSWEAGPRPEDGCWAKYWYGNVHRSTGFQAYQKKQIVLPRRLMPVLRESGEYYQILLDKAI